MDDQSIGARVKKIRKDKGLRQDQAAKILGISTTGWQKIERNESSPGAETLLQFEKFGADPGWVLTGKGNIQSHSAMTDRAGHSYNAPKLKKPSNQNEGLGERPSGLDAELMQWIVVQVSTWLKEEGLLLEPDDLWLTFITCYHLTLIEQSKGQTLPDNIVDLNTVRDVLKLAAR